MPLEIDAETFLATVTDIVAERGEYYVYPGRWLHGTFRPPGVQGARCSYTATAEAPRCLIGEVAFRHGVTDEELADWDLIGGVDDVLGAGRIATSAGILLVVAQDLQDSGSPYGYILRHLREIN